MERQLRMTTESRRQELLFLPSLVLEKKSNMRDKNGIIAFAEIHPLGSTSRVS